MRRGFYATAMLALVIGLGTAADQAMAACQGEGPYELRQCGARSWFAVPPGGPGTVSSVDIWQLGFGNKGVTAPLTDTGRGDGFGDTPLPGVFWGNDSANLSQSGLDLRDASTVSGVGGPAGSLCFSSASNWGAPGVDGCPDNDRTYAAPVDATTPPGLSDQYLNTYVNDAPPAFGYGQLDAPMAVLLKESGNTHFALAFVASRSRNQDTTDFSSGFYDFDAINNGLAKPSGGNASIVPWQPIPQLTIGTVTFVNPSDTTSDRIVTLSWPAISLVHDASVRPSASGAAQLGGATGVGVLDQGPLARYQVESAPLVGPGPTDCGSFAAIGPAVAHPGTGTTVTVPANTCLRLRTSFGRAPSASYLAAPATVATRNQNRFQARTGTLGDLGYDVASGIRTVGGALVADTAILKVASRNKNAWLVEFDSPAELNVTTFEIVGKDSRGEKVIARVNCKECNTGRPANYSVLIPSGDVKGTRSVLVVTQPSGSRSNELPLKQ